MIEIAPNGHLFTHSAQPIHNSSEMLAIFEFLSTSIQSFWALLMGQTFLHSKAQRLGLHLSLLTMAMRVRVSSIYFMRLIIFTTKLQSNFPKESRKTDWIKGLIPLLDYLKLIFLSTSRGCEWFHDDSNTIYQPVSVLNSLLYHSIFYALF